MIKLASCIEMMFTEFPFEERFAEAKKLGFAGVEFWGWENKDLAAVADASRAAAIPVTDCCVGTRDAGRTAQYARGAMLVRANAPLYAEMVEETIEAVKPAGIRTLIATTGQALPGADRQAQQEAVVACLKAAAPVLERAGVTLVLEPLNVLVNHRGYYLDTSKQAFEILRLVGSPNVKLLYDIYHQQITEGNLIQTITENIGLIGHFHVADVPGRHEAGTGEINYKNVLAAIRGAGYAGFVGCEYAPSDGKTTQESAREILFLAAAGNR
jgi:hydroxypyruvate isomerase